MTRCKFKCISELISGEAHDKNVTYEFAAVVSGSDENKVFWRWTPTGSLKFSCLNPDVEFEVGKEYYLDLSSAAV